MARDLDWLHHRFGGGPGIAHEVWSLSHNRRERIMRKLGIGIAIAAGLVFGLASVDEANAEPTKSVNPSVAYSKHGKVRQQAYWVLSYNHPGVILCVTKGDKAEAVYKVAKYAKAHRKNGYYWGGRAAKKYDRLCKR